MKMADLTEPNWVKDAGDHPGLKGVVANQRGFTVMPPVECRTGGYVQVRECSLATEPAIWLDVAEPVDLNAAGVLIPQGMRNEVELKEEQTVQLTAPQARLLRDQLDAALRFHYQGNCAEEKG